MDNQRGGEAVREATEYEDGSLRGWDRPSGEAFIFFFFFLLVFGPGWDASHFCHHWSSASPAPPSSADVPETLSDGRAGTVVGGGAFNPEVDTDERFPPLSAYSLARADCFFVVLFSSSSVRFGWGRPILAASFSISALGLFLCVGGRVWDSSSLEEGDREGGGTATGFEPWEKGGEGPSGCLSALPGRLPLLRSVGGLDRNTADDMVVRTVGEGVRCDEVIPLPSVGSGTDEGGTALDAISAGEHSGPKVVEVMVVTVVNSGAAGGLEDDAA